MRIRIVPLIVVLVIAAVGLCSSAYGQVIVDFSPDTTGVPLAFANQNNLIPGQYLGDKLTLASPSTITGGSVFSSQNATIGAPVRFVVLPDVAGVPGAVPIIDVTTTLDTVDGLFTTTQPGLTRKHATIPPTPLPAGTYWFYLAGISPVTIGQATGTYDDGQFYAGNDANPDLEGGLFSLGDNFFQIEESDPAAVPMVGRSGLVSMLLLLLAGLTAVLVRRRYSTA